MDISSTGLAKAYKAPREWCDFNAVGGPGVKCCRKFIAMHVGGCIKCVKGLTSDKKGTKETTGGKASKKESSKTSKKKRGKTKKKSGKSSKKKSGKTSKSKAKGKASASASAWE